MGIGIMYNSNLAEMIVSSLKLNLESAKVETNKIDLAIKLGRATAFASIYYYLTGNKLKDVFPDLDNEINTLYGRVYNEN